MTMGQFQQMNIQLDYESPHGQKKKQCKSIQKLDGDVKVFNEQKYRLTLVHIIRNGFEVLRACGTKFIDIQQSVLNDIVELEQAIKSHSINDKYLTDLLTDLTGQIMSAFSREDWFKKWGVHYLPSITRMLIYFSYKINNNILHLFLLKELIYFKYVIILKIQVFNIMVKVNYLTQFEMKWIVYFAVYQHQNVHNLVQQLICLSLIMLIIHVFMAHVQ